MEAGEVREVPVREEGAGKLGEVITTFLQPVIGPRLEVGGEVLTIALMVCERAWCHQWLQVVRAGLGKVGRVESETLGPRRKGERGELGKLGQRRKGEKAYF